MVTINSCVCRYSNHSSREICLHQQQLDLVDRLKKIMPKGLDRFFFWNGGADAVEACWSFVQPIIDAWKSNKKLKMSKTTFYFVIITLVIVDIVQGRYQKKLIAEEEAALNKNDLEISNSASPYKAKLERLLSTSLAGEYPGKP